MRNKPVILGGLLLAILLATINCSPGPRIAGVPRVRSHPSPPPPPPPPPPDQVQPLMWNAWVEDDAPQLAFQPVDRLKPTQDYIVGVDLAAFAYQVSSGSIASQPASSSLQRWLDGQKQSVVRLKVLIVPDPAFFTGRDQSFVDLTIDRASKDQYYAQPASPPQPADPMGELRQNSSRSYRFGSLTTPLKVHTSTEEGLAYLAISFWSGIHPVDSIVVPVCISQSDAAAPCGPVPVSIFGTSNFNRRNVGAPDPDTEPATASLHFIELPNFTWAVVRTDDPASEPVTWQLDRLPQFKATIATLLGNSAMATTDQSRLDTGASLLNAVAPPNSAGRVVFQKLLADRRAAPNAPPPLIWVRVDPADPDQWFSIPLALAAVDGQMLGDWFRAQSTLSRQDYQSLKNCISNWVKLLPPSIAGFEDAETTDASPVRQLFKDTGGFKDSFHNNTHDFTTWIGVDQPPVVEPTVLLTLSHYFQGGIGFDQANWVAPEAIQRHFTQPSVALIEGCDGALPGADEFLKKLNMVAGFQAILTTTSPVKPQEAAQYFEILNKKFADPAGYTLSRAHFEAVREMEKTPQGLALAPYGLRALIFSLLGDGSLRVCPSPLDN